jgi:hypothetical protein
MCDELEPYRGPFVVLSPDPIGYRVSIDPPPPGGDPTRTFAEKHDAWGYAREWWTALRCPLRDFTEHNTARAAADEPRKNSCSL